MIVCRSKAEIDKLRRVNQLVAEVLAELRRMAAPGVTTADIDRVAEERVRAAGAEPAFKGYHGYPATVCVSANEQVVHGIPSKRPLVEGDILSIDMGARLDGGDAGREPVGALRARGRRERGGARNPDAAAGGRRARGRARLVGRADGSVSERTVEGIVRAQLPSGLYEVEVDAHRITAHI